MGPSRVERLTGSAPLGAATSLAPAIAFVGVLATTDADTTGAAFNRAAQMFVEGLLNGLSTAGLAPDIVLGIEPIPAFPRGRRLLGRTGRFTTLGGRPVRLLPFLNVQPLKWLTTGISVSIALAGWAWRHRGRPRLVHCFNISMPPGLFVWLAARLTGTKTLVSVNDVLAPGGHGAAHAVSRAGFRPSPLAAAAVRRLDGRVARDRERFSARTTGLSDRRWRVA